MRQTERRWHRNTGHTAAVAPAAASRRFSPFDEDEDSCPRFIPHSDQEARRHASFLLITTIPFVTAKGTFLTNIEWCTAGNKPSEDGDGIAQRVRMLVEREPMDGEAAHDRAGTLARRYAVPVVLVVVPVVS